MKEYIERGPLIEQFDGGDEIKSMSESIHDSRFVDALKKAPAADVEPVRHGKWIIERKHWPSNNPYMDDNYYAGAFCSECGFCVDSKTASFGYPHLTTTLYCSACGTKMDKGE